MTVRYRVITLCRISFDIFRNSVRTMASLKFSVCVCLDLARHGKRRKRELIKSRAVMLNVVVDQRVQCLDFLGRFWLFTLASADTFCFRLSSVVFIFFSHSLSLCVCVFHGKTGHYRVGKQDSHVIGSLAWSATRVWWTHPRDFISRFGSGKFLLPRDVAIAGNAVVVVVLVDVSVCCQSRQMTRRAIFCFLDHLLIKNFWRLLVGCWWCQSLLVGPRQK